MLLVSSKMRASWSNLNLISLPALKKSVFRAFCNDFKQTLLLFFLSSSSSHSQRPLKTLFPPHQTLIRRRWKWNDNQSLNQREGKKKKKEALKWEKCFLALKSLSNIFKIFVSFGGGFFLAKLIMPKNQTFVWPTETAKEVRKQKKSSLPSLWDSSNRFFVSSFTTLFSSFPVKTK